MGHLDNYGWVYVDTNGIANNFSLAKLAEKYQVTYDSKDSNAFYINARHGVLMYQQSSSGLFYFDTNDGKKLIMTNYAIKMASGNSELSPSIKLFKPRKHAEFSKWLAVLQIGILKTWFVAIY